LVAVVKAFEAVKVQKFIWISAQLFTFWLSLESRVENAPIKSLFDKVTNSLSMWYVIAIRLGSAKMLVLSRK
jgi:hypothetical protein